MTRCAVYKAYDGGDLIYVGISVNPKQRLWFHKCRGTLPRSATVEVVRWYKTRGAAALAEKKMIRKLAPSFNVFHNPNRQIKSDVRGIAHRREWAKWEAMAAENARKMDEANAEYEAALTRGYVCPILGGT